MKWSYECELDYVNKIQLYLWNGLAIELMKGLNVDQSNVNKLIWNNECKC